MKENNKFLISGKSNPVFKQKKLFRDSGDKYTFFTFTEIGFNYYFLKNIRVFT